MKHPIDPLVDCVFKALLGSEKNKNLLIHFLNAVLEPPEFRRIRSVELLNPYNEKEFISDKLSIVDVKAQDQLERTYQIEVQLAVFPGLRARILYTWSDLYASQLQSGDAYRELQPVIAIWVLSGTLLPESSAFHHHFQFADLTQRTVLHDHASIHLLELEKWNKPGAQDEMDRWTLFFREGKRLDEERLPEFMNTQEMRQAMETLKQFSEKEKAYHLYQSRMDYLRWQRTIEEDLEAALQREAAAVREKEAALQEKETALQEKETALQEKEAAAREAARERERLLQLLKQAGIDPSAEE